MGCVNMEGVLDLSDHISVERMTGILHNQITEQNETIRVLRNKLFES